MNQMWTALIFITGTASIGGLFLGSSAVFELWKSGLLRDRRDLKLLRQRRDDDRRAFDDVERVLDGYRGGQLDVVGQALSDQVRDVLRDRERAERQLDGGS